MIGINQIRLTAAQPRVTQPDLMRRHVLAVFILIPALSACFPVHYLVQPGISGSIVDDSTSMPVADATVILSRLVHANRPLIATGTDKNGRFAIAVRQAWGIYIMPMDVFDFGGRVDIYASGYLKVSRDVRSKMLGKLNRSC